MGCVSLWNKAKAWRVPLPVYGKTKEVHNRRNESFTQIGVGKTMKPKSVEVHPVYNCNECGSRHCEALEYVNRVGRIICGCGALLELDPIKTFKIHPVYK